MDKILLIIQREYLSRVKKKSFVLTTFLVPILFIGMYAGIIYLTKKSFEDSHATVFIVDQEGSVAKQLTDTKNIDYTASTITLDEQIKAAKADEEKQSYILVVPSDFFDTGKIELLSTGKANVTTQSELRNQLSTILRNNAYEKLGINVESIREVKDQVSITAKELTESGDSKESHTEVAMGIAMALSALIYISLFLYGVQVMRGIIEEKVSRIVEVIISSVKPFQLMMGKIIGIGMVGLTQFLLWIVLSAILTTVAATLFVDKADIASQLAQGAEGAAQMEAMAKSSGLDIMNMLNSIDLTTLIVSFFIFFLGGFFLYSALFAAVGSAVDSETEATQFTTPITMPLLLTYVLSFGVLVNDPHGPVAMWLSFIPFTSPIAMLVRIPFGVPTWQIAVSAGLLVIGFMTTTWVAARIYRVGILMHGKKASYKELIKWFRYKA